MQPVLLTINTYNFSKHGESEWSTLLIATCSLPKQLVADSLVTGSGTEVIDSIVTVAAASAGFWRALLITLVLFSKLPTFQQETEQRTFLDTPARHR